MKNKSILSIILDVIMIVIMAVAFIVDCGKLHNSKEEIEVIRFGFESTIIMIGLVGYIILARMEIYFDK